MKIIVNRKDETVCYVQLRDLVFLANKNLQVFRKLSIQYINEGKTMEEFVRINSIQLIEFIAKNDDIIDFCDYANSSIENISNVIVTKNLLFKVDSESSKRIRHQTDDLQDIIAFKQGELNYQVPLVSTEDVDFTIGDVRVCSTILNNRYLVTVTGDAIVTDLLPTIKDMLINKLNLNPENEYSCEIREFGNNYLLSLVSVKKAKKNFFQLLKKRTDK